jgi:hypothetical protein
MTLLGALTSSASSHAPIGARSRLRPIASPYRHEVWIGDAAHAGQERTTASHVEPGNAEKLKLWSAEGRARVPVRRAANRMSLSLTTPSPLLTDTFAQTTLVALSSFPCSRAADHTFSEEIRVEGPAAARMSAIGRLEERIRCLRNSWESRPCHDTPLQT